MADQQQMIEDQRDRLADMMKSAEQLRQKYVEIELKYGQDVPGEGIENGELAKTEGYMQ